ncbi:hypothetical protein Tco_1383176 [Tanacetum coccineum]
MRLVRKRAKVDESVRKGRKRRNIRANKGRKRGLVWKMSENALKADKNALRVCVNAASAWHKTAESWRNGRDESVRKRRESYENGESGRKSAKTLPPFTEPCPQGSRCGTCRGCGFCEEVRILFPELIFTFPCELMTSPGVPSNFDDGNMASL